MTVRRTVSSIRQAISMEPILDSVMVTFEELFFQLGLGNLNLNGLVDLFGMAASVIGVILDGSRE